MGKKRSNRFKYSSGWSEIYAKNSESAELQHPGTGDKEAVDHLSKLNESDGRTTNIREFVNRSQQYPPNLTLCHFMVEDKVHSLGKPKLVS